MPRIRKTPEGSPESGTQIAVIGGKPEIRVQPNGGHLYAGGVPGHLGGGGRPSDEYKAWCREAATSGAVRARIEHELREAKYFPVQLWESLMDRGFGKVEHAVVEDRTVTIKVMHETDGR